LPAKFNVFPEKIHRQLRKIRAAIQPGPSTFSFALRFRFVVASSFFAVCESAALSSVVRRLCDPVCGSPR